MEAPEFLTPEDGYEQLTIPSPFNDGRKVVDIFARRMEDATEYVIYIDEHEMGDLMFTDQWYPIRDCLLTAKEISLLTPIIQESNIKTAEPKVISEQEQTLRSWLDGQSVYPNDKVMQAIVINSFYAEDTDGNDESELTELDDEAIEDLDLVSGFDYGDFETDEDEEWKEKIGYALANLDKFLNYINANWRDQDRLN
jgi:hypothetical protein